MVQNYNNENVKSIINNIAEIIDDDIENKYKIGQIVNWKLWK